MKILNNLFNKRNILKIINIKLTLEGVDTSTNVEVMESAESTDRTLILGNDWLNKVNANIDYEKGKLNIKGKNGYENIPISFFKEKEENEKEEEVLFLILNINRLNVSILIVSLNRII